MNDILSGRSLFVDCTAGAIDGAPSGLSFSGPSPISSGTLIAESDAGREETDVLALDSLEPSCDVTDESELKRVCDTLCGRDSGDGFSVCSEASEFERKERALGGLPLMRDERLLDAGDCAS